MPRGVLFFRTVQCSNGNSQTARPFRARTPAGVREDIARRYDSACLLPALAIALHGIPCRGPGRPACRARAPLRTPRRRRRQVADRPAGCARAWPLGVGGARLCLAASYLARRRSGGWRLVRACFLAGTRGWQVGVSGDVARYGCRSMAGRSSPFELSSWNRGIRNRNGK